MAELQAFAPGIYPRSEALVQAVRACDGYGIPAKVVAEGVLKPALDGLDAELVVLAEPFFARDGEAKLDALAEALDALAGGPKLALWLEFGDAKVALEQGAADL